MHASSCNFIHYVYYFIFFLIIFVHTSLKRLLLCCSSLIVIFMYVCSFLFYEKNLEFKETVTGTPGESGNRLCVFVVLPVLQSNE